MGLAAEWAGAFDESREPSCVTLSADTANDQQRVAELQAQGFELCAPEGEADSGLNWRDVHLLLSLGRNLYLVHRYRGYFKDHEAFLRKYHRR